MNRPQEPGHRNRSACRPDPAAWRSARVNADRARRRCRAAARRTGHKHGLAARPVSGTAELSWLPAAGDGCGNYYAPGAGLHSGLRRHNEGSRLGRPSGRWRPAVVHDRLAGVRPGDRYSPQPTRTVSRAGNLLRGTHKGHWCQVGVGDLPGGFCMVSPGCGLTFLLDLPRSCLVSRRRAGGVKLERPQPRSGEDERA